MSDVLPKLLSREQALLAGKALAALRGGIGALAWVAPRLAIRPWAGAVTARDPGGRLLGRALGSRDIALAAGALLAERHGGPVRGWIEAGALSDAGDVLATTLTFGELPRFTRWGVLGLTVAAVVAGGIVAPCIDREE
ncbi:MAG TPA: hypothetical protein VKU92_01855 [Acidimicrobiales bacterium]|nr:hypothetical protein [Acidimicrobiales bacterium]